jgi:hypothetical protein
MKKRTLLITTLLSSSFMLAQTPYAVATNSITTNTVVRANEPISSEAASDPRVAAQNFVAHVNYARVALAMKNAELAQQHISQARNMVVLITSATTEQRRVQNVTAGRVNYTFDTVHKNNYFPLEAGPMKIKEVSDGPIWAKNSLAVSDAEIVMLTLDLSNDKAETYLTEAEAYVKEGKLVEAQTKLGELTDAVVSVENKVSVPIDKAHDNISIAQNFLRGQNYDGARYALGHADDALDEMQNDDAYKAYQTGITEMRKEVKDMKEIITKKDPTLLQKSSKTLDKWMVDLKAWTRKQ